VPTPKMVYAPQSPYKRNRLNRSCGWSWAPFGVTVNAVSPVRDQNHRTGRDRLVCTPCSQECRSVPMGHIVIPSDIANALPSW